MGKETDSERHGRLMEGRMLELEIPAGVFQDHQIGETDPVEFKTYLIKQLYDSPLSKSTVAQLDNSGGR
ncbi:hypothetical protein J1605_017609 [Eschrichtius robustus]|uniref:Uncharacterized protein n=1 Tax=Eschrichtius robustus TaxID=9764 RepID=A0AB34HX37_ESCRO|nr:hypothetical protein J1605_017609 [Eschrichtius robustus]